MGKISIFLPTIILSPYELTIPLKEAVAHFGTFTMILCGPNFIVSLRGMLKFTIKLLLPSKSSQFKFKTEKYSNSKAIIV